MNLFSKKKKGDEPWNSVEKTSAQVRDSDRWLTSEDEAWIESVLGAPAFRVRLDKIHCRLEKEEPEVWKLYDKTGQELCNLRDYDGDDSDTIAENFVRDVVRAVEGTEVLQGFEALYRRAIALGWEMMLEDVDPADSAETSVEVERPVDYDFGCDSDDYRANVTYPLSTSGLRQFVLDLTDEEVWRSLTPYFDDIDRLGWRIVKDTGKFVLYTNLARYEQVLHPDQVEWLAKMVDTKGLSGDLLGTMLLTPPGQLSDRPI